MIHVIGDSHAESTFKGIPEVTTHHLGPLTMKRAAHEDDYFLAAGVAALALGPGDVLIVSCGEADVRCFLKPEIDAKHAAPEDLILPLVDRYLSRVAALAAKGALLGVLSAIPPATYTNVVAFRQTMVYQFPPTGTDEERAHYTRIMNRRLREGCAARGLLYVDIYTEYADDDGMMIYEQSDGMVHVGDTLQAREVLSCMGLLP